MRKFQFHVFVCTNERATGHPRGCCRSKEAEGLIPLLKAEVNRAGVSAVTRVQKAGCLDACEWGPSLVVYPENVWYGKVQPQDVAEIVQSHLVNETPVERLRIPGK